MAEDKKTDKLIEGQEKQTTVLKKLSERFSGLTNYFKKENVKDAFAMEETRAIYKRLGSGIKAVVSAPKRLVDATLNFAKDTFDFLKKLGLIVGVLAFFFRDKIFDLLNAAGLESFSDLFDKNKRKQIFSSLGSLIVDKIKDFVFSANGLKAGLIAAFIFLPGLMLRAIRFAFRGVGRLIAAGLRSVGLLAPIATGATGAAAAGAGAARGATTAAAALTAAGAATYDANRLARNNIRQTPTGRFQDISNNNRFISSSDPRVTSSLSSPSARFGAKFANFMKGARKFARVPFLIPLFAALDIAQAEGSFAKVRAALINLIGIGGGFLGSLLGPLGALAGGIGGYMFAPRIADYLLGTATAQNAINAMGLDDRDEIAAAQAASDAGLTAAGDTILPNMYSTDQLGAMSNEELQQVASTGLTAIDEGNLSVARQNAELAAAALRGDGNFVNSNVTINNYNSSSSDTYTTVNGQPNVSDNYNRISYSDGAGI